MYRRDKNIWNYNLLANPLNPANFNPAAPTVNSPHALDLSRRMQDYDLTLLPQSRVRFRVGYSYNVNSGPSFNTVEGGEEPLLLKTCAKRRTPTAPEWTTGALPERRCRLMNRSSTPRWTTAQRIDNLLFQLANGTPVDLGLVFTGTSPCAKPVTNAATTPPTVTANCNGYLSYSQVQNPRSTFPTERVSFQSTYFKKLSMDWIGGL